MTGSAEPSWVRSDSTVAVRIWRVPTPAPGSPGIYGGDGWNCRVDVMQRPQRVASDDLVLPRAVRDRTPLRAWSPIRVFRVLRVDRGAKSEPLWHRDVGCIQFVGR